MSAVRSLSLAALAAITFAVPAFAQDAPAQSNVLQTLEADGSFTTLVKAIRAAGLEDALAGAGPFTVFAPTDAAFAKLPEGTLEELIANPEALSALLQNHVVAQDIRSAAITEETRVTPLAGGDLTVIAEGGTVMIHTAAPAAEVMAGEEGHGMSMATVQRADIVASNGVIHAIDTVLTN